MTTWSYRVMRTVSGTGTTHYYTYAIYEVYYDASGKVRNWTEDAVGPRGDSVAALKRCHKLMTEAFKRPVLDAKTGKEVKA